LQAFSSAIFNIFGASHSPSASVWTRNGVVITLLVASTDLELGWVIVCR